MILASGGFTSWPGWVPAGVLVAALVGALTIWLTWKLVFSRQRLHFSVLDTALIAADGHVRAPDLKISYRDEVVQSPHVVRIRLVARSGRDIPSTPATTAGVPVRRAMASARHRRSSWPAR
jgi:hypothetical protein